MKKIISVDLGGTYMRVGLLKGFKILGYEKKDTPKDSEKLKLQLVEMISGFFSRDIKGISVSSAGPLKNGIIKNPPNLPLKNFNLKDFLEKKFKRRVVVKNDADCVAYAEAKLGYKKKNFIILTLGTGIGGGIVINGKLYRGQGYAGELGHIVLDNGRDFESLAASKNLRKITKKVFGKELMFLDLIKMKTKKSEKILKEFVEYYGQGIGSLINIFDPEIVILGGGVRECGNYLLNLIKKSVKNYSKLPKITPIEWTKLSHPGMLGAALYFY